MALAGFVIGSVNDESPRYIDVITLEPLPLYGFTNQLKIAWAINIQMRIVVMRSTQK